MSSAQNGERPRNCSGGHHRRCDGGGGRDLRADPQRTGKEAHTQDSCEAASLDLRDGSSPRSGDHSRENLTPLFLEGRKLALTIYLPFGSEVGKYDVQVRRAGEVLITAQGEAKINSGSMELRVQFDLSKGPSGAYAVAVPLAASSCVENQVTIAVVIASRSVILADRHVARFPQTFI